MRFGASGFVFFSGVGLFVLGLPAIRRHLSRLSRLAVRMNAGETL